MVVTYKLPIGQKEDENWGCSNIFFFKEWEFLNAPIVAHVSSPAAGHVWKGTILPDYGR